MVFYLHFRGLLLILKSHSIFLSPFYMLYVSLSLSMFLWWYSFWNPLQNVCFHDLQLIGIFVFLILFWSGFLYTVLLYLPFLVTPFSELAFQPCIEWILIEIIFFSVNNLPTGYIILLLFISFWAFPFFPAYWRYSASIPQKLRSVRYYFTLVRTIRTRNVL